MLITPQYLKYTNRSAKPERKSTIIWDFYSGIDKFTERLVQYKHTERSVHRLIEHEPKLNSDWRNEMSRLSIVETTCECSEVQKGFEKAQKAFGMVPNFTKVLASSPVAVNAFIDYWSAMYQGKLDHSVRVRIALALSQANACQYCVSAHSAIAEGAGMNQNEIELARAGAAIEAKEDTAVKFARAVLEHRGDVTDNELKAMHEAGFSDGEIVEIILLVGMFSAANFIGKVSRVEIDFPAVKELSKISA